MSHQEQVSEAVSFFLIMERPSKYSDTCCFSTVFLLLWLAHFNISGWRQRVAIVVNQALSGQSQYGQNSNEPIRSRSKSVQLTLSAGNVREVMATCRQFSDWLYEIVARFCSHGITKFLLTGTFTVVNIVLWKIQCTLLPRLIMLALIIWGIKNALYLSVNVSSTKVLIGDSDNIFTYPTGDETAFLLDHSSHAKV